MAQNTRILSVDRSAIADEDTADLNGDFQFDKWSFQFLDSDRTSSSKDALLLAAKILRDDGVPVAFPTETVYGLGANALSGDAVAKIFSAKRRPADNPLIVHVGSLKQLRNILLPRQQGVDAEGLEIDGFDPIPSIYKPLIKAFWPGPLSIILPNPEGSRLASEVTANLPTFAVRMPSNLVALALCRLAEVPIAAPSANLSGRPSPTTAQHVFDDLDGRVGLILDGGPCEVGVESTVVDGLSSPPCILRPGGISLEQIRQRPGWHNVTASYGLDGSADVAPKAPGMKYRHYSPSAKLLLFESSEREPNTEELYQLTAGARRVGIVRTLHWKPLGHPEAKIEAYADQHLSPTANGSHDNRTGSFFKKPLVPSQRRIPSQTETSDGLEIWDLHIGSDLASIARNLFAALRTLDDKKVGVILVEGIDDGQADELGAAIMNRLRKAAGDS